MTEHWITYDYVFDGTALLPQASVQVSAETVTEIAPHPMPGPRLAGILTPGYLDLQVNGGGGVQFNNTPTTQAMIDIAAAHRDTGTVGIMPTVITDAPNVLEQAVHAALSAQGKPGILGLHIEGPHISTVRRGTHQASFVRPMTTDTIAHVTRLRAAGIPVMITLAPEAATSDQITALAATGAIVSLGHTDADADQIATAIAAGASCGTHLFNAMSPMTSRAPGAVGGVLSADIAFGIICDGHHVDDRMIKLALRAAGPDRGFIVSDAMATVGGPDHFELYGNRVALKDGRLINAEGGLAGAHITQAKAVQRLVAQIGLTPEAALRMAITTPARVIGAPHLSTLVGRRTADLLVLHGDMRVAGTFDEVMPQQVPSDAAE